MKKIGGKLIYFHLNNKNVRNCKNKDLPFTTSFTRKIMLTASEICADFSFSIRKSTIKCRFEYFANVCKIRKYSDEYSWMTSCLNFVLDHPS